MSDVGWGDGQVVPLKIGQKGRVDHVDDNIDRALIDFEGNPEMLWVAKENWVHLQAQYDVAVAEFRTELEGAAAALGGEHPYTLATRRGLAGVRQPDHAHDAEMLGRGGEADDAVAARLLALNDVVATRGAGSAHAARARAALACALDAAGDAERAAGERAAALAALRDACGGVHPDCAALRADAAAVRLRAGDAAGAAEGLRGALSEYAAALGTRPDIRRVCAEGELADALDALGDVDAATAHRSAALAAAETLWPGGNEVVDRLRLDAAAPPSRTAAGIPAAGGAEAPETFSELGRRYAAARSELEDAPGPADWCAAPVGVYSGGAAAPVQFDAPTSSAGSWLPISSDGSGRPAPPGTAQPLSSAGSWE